MTDTEQSSLESKNQYPKKEETLLPEEFAPILQEFEPADREKVLKALVKISVKSSFAGPIPPPDVLIGYNSAMPNGADRIVSMAEKQLNHRTSLEDFAIKEELRQSGRGQIFGFILGLVGFGLATFLALQDHETIAGIFLTTTIIALVTVFVMGKKAQDKNLKEKS